jgi:hypothetical protein
METEWTPESLAAAYAETIHGPENGWGQNVHPELGRSDHIMRRIFTAVGKEEGNRIIDSADAYRIAHKES